MIEFDKGLFEGANYQHRTKEIAVPELADYFREDGKPADKEKAVFVMRGLSAAELHAVHSDNDVKEQVTKAMINLTTDGNKSAVDEIGALLGIGDKAIPLETRKQAAMIQKAMVSPEIGLKAVLKIGKHFPILFTKLYRAVNELTGEGSNLVKS